MKRYSFVSLFIFLSLLLSSSVDALSPPSLRAAPNTGWQEVGDGSASNGGISDNSGYSGLPSLAIAPDGTLYVAWTDDSSGNLEIYVRRWNGSSWEEVGTGSASGGGISNNSGNSLNLIIAIAPDNTPYVSWKDDTSGPYQIYVRRWNGTSWEEVGSGSASGGGVSNTSCHSHSDLDMLAIAPDGTPYVIWDDDCGCPDIYVRRWNGSTWEEAGAGSASGGGISNTPGRYSYTPSIAIAPDNTPYAVWIDDGRGNWDFDIYARRFYNNTWQEVGTGSASGIGIISPPADWSTHPRIAIAQDGIPYVAWRDRASGIWQVYVRRWDGGNSWEEVGAGSASGGGISNSTVDVAGPTQAFAPDGMLYVAWSDLVGGDGAVHVQRWNGSSWEEVGASPASDGHFSGWTSRASVAIAPDGTPYIAWDDNSSGDYEIYVRRWVPNTPPTADAGGPYEGDEGSPITLDGSGSFDLQGDPLSYEWDLDEDGEYDDASGVNPSYTWYDDETSLTIGLRVTDDKGAFDTDSTIVTVNNVAPTVGEITAPVDPVQVNTEVSASVNFTDPGVLDTHTAVWDWGDDTTSSGTVNETNGSGSVSGSHAYATPGVYTVRLTVTDDDGSSDESIFEFVVVYDPAGGFVTGGGWIDSPEGAYTPDPSLTGKATFGFVSKYKKGADAPTGQTQFQFHVADLNFHSTSYQWLVIAGPKAQFKGDGTINGAGNYGFLLKATDGQVSGGGGDDKFRIKIWDKDNGDAIVYDNQMGDAEDADPTTAIGGGSIVVHKAK